MKYIFIVNPIAGKNKKDELINKINSYFSDTNLNYEIYFTKESRDATDYVKKCCLNRAENEHLRFYACGGDGTLNEVVDGALGFENVDVGVIPCGTGNDFYKNFENPHNFFDIEKQVNAGTKKIDILKINDRISVNVANAGFDGDVAANYKKFKNLPLVHGSAAYTLSVFYCFFNRISHRLTFKVDDKEPFTMDCLLCVTANAPTYGGGYRGAPEADINDGLLDLCIVKKVSRPTILKIIGIYKKGNHLTDKTASKYIIYQQCKKVTISCDYPINISLDGEMTVSDKIEAEVLPNCVNFITP